MAEGSGAIRAGEAFIEIGGDSNKLEHELKHAEDSLKGWGVRLAAIGAAISAVGFGIAKVFERAAEAAGEEQAAEAQIAAAIKSTGGAAGVTVEQLKNLAEGFMQTSTFADDVVLSGEALLLTFDKVGKEAFAPTMQAAIDMSVAFKQDLQTSIFQIGKALQSPLVGMLLLRRAGVDFDDQQKEMITTLVKSGDLLGAQNIILGRLQEKFGGRAAADLNTYSGRMKSFHVALNEVQEAIGFALLPKLTEFAISMKGVADKVKEFVKTHPALIQGLAKISVGLIAVGAAIATVGAAFLFISSPAIMAITAIGVSVVAIIAQLNGVSFGLNDMVEEFRSSGEKIEGTWKGVIVSITDYWDEFHDAIKQTIIDIESLMDNLTGGLRTAFAYWSKILGFSSESDKQGALGKINKDTQENEALRQVQYDSLNSETDTREKRKKALEAEGPAKAMQRALAALWNPIADAADAAFYKNKMQMPEKPQGSFFPMRTDYGSVGAGQRIGEHLGFSAFVDLQRKANELLGQIADNTGEGTAMGYGE